MEDKELIVPLVGTPINVPVAKLTRKQKAFADYLLNNPKASAAEAIRQVYDIGSKHGITQKNGEAFTSSMMARENLQKPAIMLYLQNHGIEAETTLVDIMQTGKKYSKTGTKEGASYAAVAVSAAKDILDRVHGKATQKVETTGVTLQISVDMGATDATN